MNERTPEPEPTCRHGLTECAECEWDLHEGALTGHPYPGPIFPEPPAQPEPDRDHIEELCALIDAAGATLTFDDRRYARAAQSWPDHLPPMFGEAAAAVERWGMGAYPIWERRRPEGWPVPTVRVGELWEQKSALVPTWEVAR